MRDMLIVSKGSINLYGFFKDRKGEEFGTRVVNLPRKSWYGDYQILLDMNSTFEVVADKVHNLKKNPDAKKVHDDLPGMTQVYLIDGECLLNLLDEQPEFKQVVLLRSMRRRSHF